MWLSKQLKFLSQCNIMSQPPLPYRGPRVGRSTRLPTSTGSGIMSPPRTVSGSSTQSIPDQPLDPWKDARDVIRLLQCPQCSRVLRNPVTLLCGNTLCSTCIPELQPRTDISTPETADGLYGPKCPFETCEKRHVAANCSLNAVLCKILGATETEMAIHKTFIQEPEGLVQTRIRLTSAISLPNSPGQSQLVPGGRLLATYSMAEEGHLPYDSGVEYGSDPLSANAEQLDAALYECLKEATRPAMVCQLCSEPFTDPLIGGCGHTFCRDCMSRIFDGSNLCPTCQHSISEKAGSHDVPANDLLVKWRVAFFCKDPPVFKNVPIVPQDRRRDTPLLIRPSVVLPHATAFAWITDISECNMIRQLLQIGRPRFGMARSNPSFETQGRLEWVPFAEFATLVKITGIKRTRRGGLVLRVLGLHPLKIVECVMTPGCYWMCAVEQINDLSPSEEAAFEAAEVMQLYEPQSQLPFYRNLAWARTLGQPGHRLQHFPDLELWPTIELLIMSMNIADINNPQISKGYRERLIIDHGTCPPDTSRFTWWFAAFVALNNHDMYRLLWTASVRERLKLCAGWGVMIRQVSSSSRIPIPIFLGAT
jgi:hypothetical protein